MPEITNRGENGKALRLIKFGYASFLVMWAICLMGELLFLFFSHCLSLVPEGNVSWMTDFGMFYVAGKITLSPVRNLLYSWDVQRQFLETFTHCSMDGRELFIQSTPILFLLMAPYALLPMDSAHLLFDLVNLGIGISGCWFVIKHFGWSDNRMAKLVLVGALASMPSWNTWLLGQLSWLYLGIVCFYIGFLLEKKDIKGGFALALCLIKPQHAMFLLIPALALKRYRMLFWGACWGGLLFVICTLVFGLKPLLAYPSIANHCEAYFQSMHSSAMYCLRPFFELFRSQPIAYRYSFISALLVWVLITGISIYGLRKRNTKSAIAWMISLVVLSLVLFSPHINSHDCLFLVVPALLTLPAEYFAKAHQSPSIFLWRWIFYLLPVISWFCLWLFGIHLSGNLWFTVIVAILFVLALKQFLLEIKSPAVMKELSEK